MIRKYIIYFIPLIFAGICVETINNANSENLSHVLISEIQISGESASDEFVELYNPTGAEIDLKNWDIKKITNTGTIENIVTNMEGTIPASGYFLIVPRDNCGEAKNEACYKGSVKEDEEYTTNNYLSKDNAILLYDQNNNLVDKAGWGASLDFEGEAFQDNPQGGQSLERKIVGSVVQDTDNNKNDFVLQEEPSPKNTKSISQNIEDQGNSNENGQSGNQNQESANQNNETQDSGMQGGSLSGSYAQNHSAKLIITEFLPNPEDSDSDNEFIEIYNAGSQDENMGGWTMEDRVGKIKSYAIPENTILKSGEYKAFMSGETKIILNNSGDGIVLKDKKGEIQDETPLSGAAGEDVSYALKSDGYWTWTKKPTPGAKNIIETGEEGVANEAIDISKAKTEDVPEGNYDYSDGIIITEIFPNPEGLDNKFNYEWIEIYNDSEKEVNLKGWIIDDVTQKGSKPYVIGKGKTIAPGGYLEFSNEETKIILNNTEDEVNLLWPDGTIVDSVSYKKPKEGFSYALFDNGKWGWSSKPSLGKQNAGIEETEAVDKKAREAPSEDSGDESEADFADQENEIGYAFESEAAEFIETDVESAKKLPRYSNIKISGIVSVPPGIFQDNMFYISGSGMQVFSYSDIFREVKLGDKAELFGKMSEVGGEIRMIVESPDCIKIISHDNLLEAKMISTGEVGEKYEGYLVLTEGDLIRKNSEVFYIDDGSGQAKIFIKPGTKIINPEIKIGDTANVTGIVSRTSLGYRILPRFQNDIRIGKTSSISISRDKSRKFPADENSAKKENHFPIYYYGFLMAGLVVLIDWGRMKAKK